MRMLLTKYANTTLIIIIVPLMISTLCPLLFVRPGGSMVNLCVFYFYRLIGKLTDFLQIQAKAATLRIMLNVDGEPIDSRSHTHPSSPDTPITHSKLSLINLFSIVRCSRSPPQPSHSVCETLRSISFRLVFHYTDTQLYVFSLTLSLPVVHNK
jgi:hypothetical protein